MIELISKYDTTFEIDNNLLITRSKIFRDIIKDDDNITINVDETTSNLKNYLNYLILEPNDIKPIESIIEANDILQVSDKYQDSLTSHLIESDLIINVVNFSLTSLYSLACKYNLPRLKTFTLNRVKPHHLQLLTKEDGDNLSASDFYDLINHSNKSRVSKDPPNQYNDLLNSYSAMY